MLKSLINNQLIYKLNRIKLMLFYFATSPIYNNFLIILTDVFRYKNGYIFYLGRIENNVYNIIFINIYFRINQFIAIK